MPTSRFQTYDIISAFFWRVGNDCYNYAQLDPDGTLTPDTTSNALGYIGEIGEANLPEAIYKRFTFGQSRYLGSAYSGIEPIGEFTMQLSTVDLRLDVLLNNATIDTTTVTNANISSPNHNNQSPNPIGLCVTVKQHSSGDGCDGATYYETFIIPRATAFANRGSATASAGNDTQPVTVTVAPTMASNHAWGTAFGSDENFAGNKTELIYMGADAPYGCTTYIADGISTSYTVEYVPRSSDVTDGKTTNVFTVNGTVTAPTSFDTATGTVTLAAAGSSGDVCVAFYQLDVPNIRTI